MYAYTPDLSNTRNLIEIAKNVALPPASELT